MTDQPGHEPKPDPSNGGTPDPNDPGQGAAAGRRGGSLGRHQGHRPERGPAARRTRRFHAAARRRSDRGSGARAAGGAGRPQLQPAELRPVAVRPAGQRGHARPARAAGVRRRLRLLQQPRRPAGEQHAPLGAHQRRLRHPAGRADEWWLRHPARRSDQRRVRWPVRGADVRRIRPRQRRLRHPPAPTSARTAHRRPPRPPVATAPRPATVSRPRAATTRPAVPGGTDSPRAAATTPAAARAATRRPAPTRAGTVSPPPARLARRPARRQPGDPGYGQQPGYPQTPGYPPAARLPAAGAWLRLGRGRGGSLRRGPVRHAGAGPGGPARAVLPDRRHRVHPARPCSAAAARRWRC